MAALRWRSGGEVALISRVSATVSLDSGEPSGTRARDRRRCNGETEGYKTRPTGSGFPAGGGLSTAQGGAKDPAELPLNAGDVSGQGGAAHHLRSLRFSTLCRSQAVSTAALRRRSGGAFALISRVSATVSQIPGDSGIG